MENSDNQIVEKQDDDVDVDMSLGALQTAAETGPVEPRMNLIEDYSESYYVEVVGLAT